GRRGIGGGLDQSPEPRSRKGANDPNGVIRPAEPSKGPSLCHRADVTARPTARALNRPENTRTATPAASMVSFGRTRLAKALRHDGGAHPGADSKSTERTHLGPSRRRRKTVTVNAGRLPDDACEGATTSGRCALPASPPRVQDTTRSRRSVGLTHPRGASAKCDSQGPGRQGAEGAWASGDDLADPVPSDGVGGPAWARR